MRIGRQQPFHNKIRQILTFFLKSFSLLKIITIIVQFFYLNTTISN